VTQHPVEGCLGTVVAVAPGEVAHDDAAAEQPAGLEVGGGDAVVADVRRGEGDDLPRIGRIGEHLLVAGEGGVEHDLTAGGAVGRLGTEEFTLEHRSVGEHECGISDGHGAHPVTVARMFMHRFACSCGASGGRQH